MACDHKHRVDLQLTDSTYMDWPVFLLHVVGCDEVGHTGKFVEQTILETKHGRRADNGCLRVDLAHETLTPALNIISPSLAARHNQHIPLYGRIQMASLQKHCMKRRG
jgi:hypothetical protein